MNRAVLVTLGVTIASCAQTIAPPGSERATPARIGAEPRIVGPDSGARHATLPDAGKPDSGFVAPPTSGVSVLTQHNNLARTGANLAETTLTTASVGGGYFGKFFTRTVDDQVYAQPLVASAVALPGRGSRNVLYVATVNDTIYAFDADDPTERDPIWVRSFLSPGVVPPRNTDMTGACGGHYSDFSGNIGIVGTPVIDPVTETLYAVARTHEGGKFVQRLHAISIVDGTERANSPRTISASVPGTGEGGTTITFDDLKENQRAALLLLGGIVYVGWAGHCDWGPYHGWILGYDAASLAQKIVYNTTPNGNAGGVWQSGQGPSSDGTDIFVVTGNGTVGDGGDPRSPIGRGESFLKLRRTDATLKVESFFTPYNYQALEEGDIDLGAAGMVLIPDTRLGVSGGKEGIMYVADLDAMGGLTDSTSVNDNVIQSFAVNAEDPERIAGSPVFWKGPKNGFVYVWGQNDALRAFPFLGATYTPGSIVLDTAHVVKNEVVPIPDNPGAMLSVSANGDARGSGIVWASRPRSGNANQRVQPGILSAFDAETLVELWDSEQNPMRDDCGNFAKFSFPTIANGKVYLASFSNQICVYANGTGI